MYHREQNGKTKKVIAIDDKDERSCIDIVGTETPDDLACVYAGKKVKFSSCMHPCLC
jgi:predicted Zn-dependent protease with MMP-like domain